MVAQLLQNPALLLAPWEATAALYTSLVLSIVAVVVALHETIYLNSAFFQPTIDEKLKCVFHLQRETHQPRSSGWRKIVFLGALSYSIPQILLSYSVFGSLLGMGLMVVNPLSRTDSNKEWGGAQKVGLNVILQSLRQHFSLLSRL